MEKAGRDASIEYSVDRMHCHFMGSKCRTRFNHNFPPGNTHIPGYEIHPVNPVHPVLNNSTRYGSFWHLGVVRVMGR